MTDKLSIFKFTPGNKRGEGEGGYNNYKIKIYNQI